MNGTGGVNTARTFLILVPACDHAAVLTFFFTRPHSKQEFRHAVSYKATQAIAFTRIIASPGRAKTKKKNSYAKIPLFSWSMAEEASMGEGAAEAAAAAGGGAGGAGERKKFEIKKVGATGGRWWEGRLN